MTRLDFPPDDRGTEAINAVRALVARHGGWSPSLPAESVAAMEADMAQAILRNPRQ